jgi:hypothetical protein
MCDWDLSDRDANVYGSGYHDGRFTDGTEISPGQALYQSGCSIEYSYVTGGCYGWIWVDACGGDVKYGFAIIGLWEMNYCLLCVT